MQKIILAPAAPRPKSRAAEPAETFSLLFDKFLLYCDYVFINNFRKETVMIHPMRHRTLALSLLSCALLLVSVAGFQVLADETPAASVEVAPDTEAVTEPAVAEAPEALPAQPAAECNSAQDNPLLPTTAGSCTAGEPCWSHDDCGGLENGWCLKFEKVCWCA